MSLRSRLILLMACFLVASVVLVSGLLSWSSQNSIAQQTENDALLLAQLLSRSAGLLDKVPEDVESLVGEEMSIHALFAAHITRLTNGNKEKTLDILNSIIEITSLNEISITDSEGAAYIQSHPTPFPYTFKEKSEDGDPNDAFYPLLTGKQQQYIQNSYIRDYDEKMIKFAGVSGIDQPRIVQVGKNVEFLSQWKERLGFQRLVDGLMETNAVNAIWVIDKDFETLAHGAKRGIGAEKTPTDLELDYLERVIEKGDVLSIFHENLLKVMAPIIGKEDAIVGATLIQLPTTQLQKTLETQLEIAAIVVFCVLLLGLSLAYWMAEWVSKPVTEISKAAAGIENHAFDPDSLDDLSTRKDELGNLSRVFQGMAKKVMMREEKLDALVRVRTRDLEVKTKAVQEALEKLKSTQTQLVAKEKLASLGELTAGIAHELKNPLNFVINFSSVTQDIADELFEVVEKQKEKLSEEDAAYLLEISGDVKENAKKMNEHGKHAESIINSMIEHSHNQTTGQEKTEMIKFTQDTVKYCHRSLSAKDQKFKCDIKTKMPDTEIFSKIDPGEINRVLQYVLDNAFYAVHEKADQSDVNYVPEILVKLQDNGENFDIIVYDNGTGILEENMDKIFNPFFTTKPTRRGNTGMGLSISYDIIVQQHQGQVNIRSEAGKFTEVTIKLPKFVEKAE